MRPMKQSKLWNPTDPSWYPPGRRLASAVPVSLQVKRSAGRAKLTGEGHCRMCLRASDVRPLTRHHLIKQEWFSQQSQRIDTLRNCDAVMVPLCRPCHNDVEADRSARRMLRRLLTQGEVAFCIALRGKEWFDHRYPVR